MTHSIREPNGSLPEPQATLDLIWRHSSDAPTSDMQRVPVRLRNGKPDCRDFSPVWGWSGPQRDCAVAMWRVAPTLDNDRSILDHLRTIQSENEAVREALEACHRALQRQEPEVETMRRALLTIESVLSMHGVAAKARDVIRRASSPSSPSSAKSPACAEN